MLSFKFNGKDSFSHYGILVETRPHVFSPERRVSYINVKGRDSALRNDEKTYDDITIAVECSFKGNLYQQISDIKAWLLNAGESDLIFSYQSDKKYLAQVVSSMDFEVALRITSKFVILFNCQPFQYAVDNAPIIISDSASNTLTNPSSIASFPIIKVNGTGACDITVNGNFVSFSNIDGSVTVNSEIQETYEDTGTELVNKNSTKTGDFPVLKTGINTISFAGGTTSLEIIPNWRWL